MKKLIKIEVGEMHGLLKFVSHLEKRNSTGHAMSRWLCECGEATDVRTWMVTSGYTKSCGRHPAKPNLKHGMKGTPTYSSWAAMRARCLDKGNKDYPRWGGKGITICERWSLFENFFEYMGERPEGMSIDRFPNRKGNYEPGNCRWATSTQQQENKDNFVIINTPHGSLPLRDYAKMIGISAGAAHMRLKRGKLEGCSK